MGARLGNNTHTTIRSCVDKLKPPLGIILPQAGHTIEFRINTARDREFEITLFPLLSDRDTLLQAYREAPRHARFSQLAAATGNRAPQSSPYHLG